jgi:cytochrome b6-f complex iron-sulfur subunit
MAEATVRADGLTRREFLYYIWGASLALFTVELTGLTIWFLLPRFREGEFGGVFKLPVDILPDANAPPENFADGRFWLITVNTTEPNDLMCETVGDDGEIVGAAAIYKVCTHLGCIYAWVPANDRFECPCHGSKYRLDGRRIQGPAPRNLDRFKMTALDADETEIVSSALTGDGTYDVLQLPPETAWIAINTGDRKDGHSQRLLNTIPESCP